jgi:hypothetical protein
MNKQIYESLFFSFEPRWYAWVKRQLICKGNLIAHINSPTLILWEYHSLLPKQPILGWWMISFLHWPRLTHTSTIKTNINTKPMRIYTHRHEPPNLELIRMHKNMSKWEVVMFLLCWELTWGCWLQSMLATLMQTLHEQQWCFILVKSEIIYLMLI